MWTGRSETHSKRTSSWGCPLSDDEVFPITFVRLAEDRPYEVRTPTKLKMPLRRGKLPEIDAVWRVEQVLPSRQRQAPGLFPVFPQRVAADLRVGIADLPERFDESVAAEVLAGGDEIGPFLAGDQEVHELEPFGVPCLEPGGLRAVEVGGQAVLAVGGERCGEQHRGRELPDYCPPVPASPSPPALTWVWIFMQSPPFARGWALRWVAGG